jgi:hypothetical protein|tara:strand:- start:43 stop:201 length:159 start_codon:yes stop_codon:yes gene_type:complete
MLENKSGLFGINKLIRYAFLFIAVVFLYFLIRNSWDVSQTFIDIGNLLGKIS